MAQISSWRLVIRHTPVPAAQQATAEAVTGKEAGQDFVNVRSGNTQQQQHLTGHPAPLRWADLQSGLCWCIGAVQQQQQEQSCWLRFKLPAELQQDQQLMAAAAAEQLVSCCMWLGKPQAVEWYAFDWATWASCEARGQTWHCECS